MKTKFNITPADFRKAVGVSQQRVSQLIANKTLKENVHYLKIGTKFYLYSQAAVNKLKER